MSEQSGGCGFLACPKTEARCSSLSVTTECYPLSADNRGVCVSESEMSNITLLTASEKLPLSNGRRPLSLSTAAATLPERQQLQANISSIKHRREASSLYKIGTDPDLTAMIRASNGIGLYDRCREAFKWLSCTNTIGISNNTEKVNHVDYNEAKSWQQSFSRMLNNPVGRRQFREYLESEHAEENIFFWELIEEYRQLTNSDELYDMAQEIYKRFLNTNSTSEINIDIKCRNALNQEMKRPTRNTFDEAQRQVYKLMERDSYTRFIRSNEYFMFLINNLSRETVENWGKDFEAMMSHEEGQRLFREYLVTERADENVKFWSMAKQYAQIEDFKQRKALATEIYRTFISPDAKTEISIDGSIRAEISHNYEQAEKNLFEKAEKFIFELMKRDCFPRFASSSFFKDFQMNHEMNAICYI
ncbi:Regulator of G-protein signaling 1 [Trichinella pseudospiralis]|uniref:Regulator of G-protein signaling 1 n=1 Tax=Trichinella pseudospiralis TaxID=6337 RepID=A0A0V1IB86_TRIPS|nr:Regulator of G-protein signaling 1 [Trichinella pseudospiralis]KRZ20070.1 Regulator of G-protein signaling 1 [Trichinella pseudospiralis]KRZ26448.1 Regulator of G-protein signaling 1 [Trichinella pseudospiralis]